MNFQDIIVSLKRVATRVPTGKEGSIFLYRDWQRLILSLLVTLLLSVLFGVYVFYQISSGDASSLAGSDGQHLQVVSREKLDGVIASFSQKETLFLSRKNQRPSVPSL